MQFTQSLWLRIRKLHRLRALEFASTCREIAKRSFQKSRDLYRSEVLGLAPRPRGPRGGGTSYAATIVVYTVFYPYEVKAIQAAFYPSRFEAKAVQTGVYFWTTRARQKVGLRRNNDKKLGVLVNCIFYSRFVSLCAVLVGGASMGASWCRRNELIVTNCSDLRHC